jgi:hypothetical protein
MSWNGISNIQEGCWETDCKMDLSGSTNNPALQLTPDGQYRLVSTAYAWDLAVSQESVVELELHNSSPMVSAGTIADQADGAVWEAEWQAVQTDRGLDAEFVVLTNQSVQLGQTLDATVLFSEPMNTSSVEITAGKAPGYNDLTVTTIEWTCTNNPEPYYDTWNGTIEVPAEGYSGWITLKVEGEDSDGNCLKDPAGAFDERSYSDTYHGFGIAFGPEEGWPVDIWNRTNGCPALGDVDGDGTMEMAFQCPDGYVDVLDSDGGSYGPWPLDSGDWSECPAEVQSSPALADLDSDGDLDIISVLPTGCDARDALTGNSIMDWPWFNDDPIAPANFFSQSSPAVFDVDSDGDPEVVICRHLTPTTGLNVTVYMLDNDASFEWGQILPEGSAEGTSVVSTPAFGDVDGDGEIEVVVATAEFYPALGGQGGGRYIGHVYTLSSQSGAIEDESAVSCNRFWASPVVVDIDGDEALEVIIGTSDRPQEAVFVLNGADLSAEQILESPGGEIRHPAAIGDLDGDGGLDFVVSSADHKLYAWSGSDYQPLEGFPVELDGTVPGCPLMLDIDVDYELEVVVATNGGNLYGINPDGTVCCGFPVSLGHGGNLAAGDIDADNHLELLVSNRNDSAVMVYDLGDGSYPIAAPWRQFQHDSWHTGCFEADNTVPAPPTNLEGDITYSAVGAEVDLSWDLSVNDYYSPNPQDPADVICYFVYREWENRTLELLDRVPAGDGSYTDTYTFPSGPIVRYVVTAFDGTNESVYSNEVRFHSTDQLNLALGRPVREVFEAVGATASVSVGTSESALITRRATDDVIVATPSIRDSHLRSGNAECLTDGKTDEVYTPSAGAVAVVIDLGGVHEVTDVIVSGGSEAAMHGDDRRHSILLAREAGQYTVMSDDGNAASVRYVHVKGAAGAEEILVYGETARSERVNLQTIRSSGGWSISLPSADRSSESVTAPSTGSTSEEGALVIYDITGRRVWSTRAEAGSTVSWDGRRDSGSRVPSGVYLVRFQCGNQVSTGRLEVIGSAD